ncbi:MAG: hypothetical protein HPY51_18565 [Candidatus Omnitrophica bacterium]|nr:hypothetical protein [Candidatus Omnitrophota bacterium]
MVTQSGGTYGDAIGGVDRVRKIIKKGYFTDAKEYIDDDSSRSLIEIIDQPIWMDSIQEVRGSYQVLIPQFKRIQLEIDYEIPYEIMQNNEEYFVEIFERNKLNQDEWVKSKTIKNYKSLPEDLNIFDSKIEKYSLHTSIVNLSDWSGREIRLDLVWNFSHKNFKTDFVRWTRLKIIGSTFDYHFVDSNYLSEYDPVQQMKLNFLDGLYQDPYLEGSFAFAGLTSYPDTGFAPIRINSRSYAYFNSGYPSWNMFVNGSANSGTLMLDFLNKSNNLASIPVSNMPNCVLRGNPPYPTSSDITPYSAIRPYRPAYPLSNLAWKYNWDNGYTGVNSAFVATDSGYTRVHAFLHVEDWFKNINTPGFLSNLLAGYNITPEGYDYVYARIGYARSPNNDPFNLSFARCSQDLSSSTINNASPIIECFQKEGQQTENHGVCGAASPAVITAGNYTYLFYTRYVQKNWVITTSYYIEPLKSKLGGEYLYNRTICAARVLTSTLVDESYSANNPSSPWRQFYDGEWSQNGIGGLSTSLIGDITNLTENRVLCNVMLNGHLGGNYLMLAWNDINRAAYLYISQNLENPQWGTGIQINIPSNETPIRLVDHLSGDDKYGGEYVKLFTRTSPPIIVKRYIVLLS